MSSIESNKQTLRRKLKRKATELFTCEEITILIDTNTFARKASFILMALFLTNRVTGLQRNELTRGYKLTFVKYVTIKIEYSLKSSCCFRLTSFVHYLQNSELIN